MKSIDKYYYANIVFGLFLSVISFLFLEIDFYILKIFPILTLVSILLMLFYYRNVYDNYFNFDSLFVLLLWVFGMSRQLTALVGFESYTSYYGSYSYLDYGKAYLFTYLCIFMYYAFSYSKNRVDIKYESIKKANDLRKIIICVLLVCFVPMMWYYYRLISVSLTSKYGSREFDALVSNTGYIVSLLRKWGILALISLMIVDFNGNNKTNKLITLLFYIVLTFVSLLSGSRSEGISMLLVLLFVLSFKYKNSKSFKIGSVVSVILIMILIPFFFALRKDISQFGTLNFRDFINVKYVFSALHEMGGSEEPLLLVMKSEQDFRYGGSILVASLNTIFNFLPASFRPDFSFIGPSSLANSFSRALGLNYGLGFSLAAEAYLNFSWFGCLLFGVLSFLLRKIYSRKFSLNSFISSTLFLFLLLTMPRRETKDLFLELLYYWFPFEILIVYFFRTKKTKGVLSYAKS